MRSGSLADLDVRVRRQRGPSPDPGRVEFRHGTGASIRNSPSCFNSLQNAAGIAWRNAATLRVTCSGSSAPGITAATAGWPSGNCSAAAESGTLWRAHTASIRFTLVRISGVAPA
jgi:hypothetical protein